MRRLHHMTISAEGVYYLIVMGFILTAAIVRQINLLMILYGVLTGPLLLSWPLVRRQLKRIDVARLAPKTVVADRPFTVELEVRNGRRGGSFALVLRDELERRGRRGVAPPPATDVYCDYVPGDSTRHLSYQGRIERRGIYEFLPIKLSSRFPLGLLKTMVRIDVRQRILVLPRLGKLAPTWRRLLKADAASGGGSQRRVGLHEGDFYGLRDWRPGDPRNRIHWRTSARRQALTVRQYERRRHADLLLVVDLWEPAKPTAADQARTESVISFAATLLAETSRDGGRVRFELIAKRPRNLDGTVSPAMFDEAWKMLAAAEPTPGDSLPAVLNEALAGERPQTSVIAVSTRPIDLADGERFLPDSRVDLQAWTTRMIALSPGDAAWGEVFQEGGA